MTLSFTNTPESHLIVVMAVEKLVQLRSKKITSKHILLQCVKVHHSLQNHVNQLQKSRLRLMGMARLQFFFLKVKPSCILKFYVT